MINRLRRSLSLTTLEDRVTPALTVSYLGGNLSISGVPSTNVNVAWVPGGFKVMDGANNLGTYTIAGNLSVSLTNYDSITPLAAGTAAVSVDLGGHQIPGNLSITLGIGDVHSGTVNPIEVFSSAAGGNVGGTVSISGGNGSEDYTIGFNNASKLAAVSIGGDLFVTSNNNGGVARDSTKAPFNNYSLPLGVQMNGDVLVIGTGSKVGRDVTTTSTDNVFVGTLLGSPTIGRNVTLNDINAPQSAVLSINTTVPGLATFIGTNSGANGGDLVFLDALANVGQVQAAFFGAGDEYLANVGSNVAGNVNLSSSNGQGYNTSGKLDPTVPAHVVIDQGNIGGNLTVNFGSGGSSFDYSGTTQGNVTWNAANGNNNIGGTAFAGFGTIFTGFIGGNLSMTLGNGTNTFALGVGASVGNNVTYTGGNVTDSVTIRNANTFRLTVNFGNGANTFTYAANSSVGSAVISFGPGPDTYIQDPTVIVNWNQVIKGLH